MLVFSFVQKAVACCQRRVGVIDVCRQQVLAGESSAPVAGTLVVFLSL